MPRQRFALSMMIIDFHGAAIDDARVFFAFQMSPRFRRL